MLASPAWFPEPWDTHSAVPMASSRRHRFFSTCKLSRGSLDKMQRNKSFELKVQKSRSKKSNLPRGFFGWKILWFPDCSDLIKSCKNETFPHAQWDETLTIDQFFGTERSTPRFVRRVPSFFGSKKTWPLYFFLFIITSIFSIFFFIIRIHLVLRKLWHWVVWYRRPFGYWRGEFEAAGELVRLGTHHFDGGLCRKGQGQNVHYTLHRLNHALPIVVLQLLKSAGHWKFKSLVRQGTDNLQQSNWFIGGFQHLQETWVLK